MTRKCPIENCPNNRPSAGKKPNGEQKYRARCRKHQKEWRQFPEHATGKTMVMPADMKEVKSEKKNFVEPIILFSFGLIWIVGMITIINEIIKFFE